MLEIMERNHHGFHTVPREDPMPAGQMELVGPPGTVIPTRCYHLVESASQRSRGSIHGYPVKDIGTYWNKVVPPVDSVQLVYNSNFTMVYG